MNALKHAQYITLQHIIQQGHKKYLKQSRLSSSQTSYNILRVLSAFKQMFPTSPDHLYKLIILMTKKYNPQTLEQWKKAIDKINQVQDRKSTSNHDKSYQRRNSCQNQIRNYQQDLDHEIGFVESKRSRLKFRNGMTQPSCITQHNDKENVMAHSNLNSLRNSQYQHYISFQPIHVQPNKKSIQKHTYQNSRSLNSTQFYKQKKINPYSQITKLQNLSHISPQKEESSYPSKQQTKTHYSQNNIHSTYTNSRLINLPSRTPRQQTIIDIKTCSNISMKKSQMIQTQSDLDYLQFTPEQWEIINVRTKIFYQFNTKLKAFSAILANCQAYGVDRHLKMKADIFHQTYLASKVIINLKSNVMYQVQNRTKQQKATQLYQVNLKKKVWKIFNILKTIKISSKSKSIFQVKHCNRLNYQFFLSFMFQEKSSSLQKSRIVDSTKNQLIQKDNFGIQKRAEYFSQTLNFDKVWDIYKCFGLNITFQKQQMKKFFKNYHNCLYKMIFQILKKNKQQKKGKFIKIHNNRLIQKSYVILVTKWKMAKQQKAKLFLAQSWANQKIKQKIYKVFLSMVYSTKIFSKRSEFITNKKADKMKKTILKKWILQCKQKQYRKKQRNQRINLGSLVLIKFLKKLSFKSVLNQSKQILEQIKQSQTYISNKLIKKTFQHMKNLIINKKAYIKLCQNSQQYFKRNILQKWHKYTILKQELDRFCLNIKKLIFKKCFIPLNKEIVKNFLINQQNQRNILKQCFDELVKNKIQYQSLRNSNINRFNKFNQTKRRNDFFSLLKLNLDQNKRARQNQQLQQNSSLVKLNLSQSKLSILLSRWKNTFNQIKKTKTNQLQISIMLKKQALKFMSQKRLQSNTLQINQNQLLNSIKWNNLRDLVYCMKLNLYQTKRQKLQTLTKKNIYQQFIKSLQQKTLQTKQKQQQAIRHFNKKTYHKGLLSIVNQFIDISQKEKMLNKTLKKSRPVQYFHIFCIETRKSIQIKAHKQKVQKKLSLTRLSLKLKQSKRLIQLKNIIKRNQLTNLFSHLNQHCSGKDIKLFNQNKTQQLQKNIVFIRFNNFFVNQLIGKKHLYMAYKFRAIKLQYSVFNKWRLSLPKNRYKQVRIKQQQQSFVCKQKDALLGHMYKPTDCQ